MRIHHVFLTRPVTPLTWRQYHVTPPKRVHYAGDTVTFGNGQNELIGTSPAMQEVHRQIKLSSRSTAPVLITGPSGTGKELVARAIHKQSTHSNKPFVAINCAAFPETLLESELFGYVQGAFTGANKNKAGLLKAAEGGTLFLDEIGDMPLHLQAKLLRVLQEGEYSPVGATKPQACDVRIVAATNRNLQTEINEKRFREDLYYRLNVMRISLPALAERVADIGILVHYLVPRLVQKYTIQAPGFTESESKDKARAFTAEAITALQSYHWPGNIRQLENVLVRLLSNPLPKAVTAQEVRSELAKEPQLIETEKHPQPIPNLAASLTNENAQAEFFGRRALSEILDEITTVYFAYLIRLTHNNKQAMAKIAKLRRQNLYTMLHKFGLFKAAKTKK